ncbi:hypothetical protein DSM104329_04867 [Capillimicrobium parvum]|uniref:Solute-binding protein family 5 domain-containing protein n=2 Tax=Capillimicrobium parvum TaxID=2884022 RepID=A0A9E6Y1K7_9ACTN|nr:hypothetical protein DSM104329_04867 [Capillimicrobium parvum]
MRINPPVAAVCGLLGVVGLVSAGCGTSASEGGGSSSTGTAGGLERSITTAHPTDGTLPSVVWNNNRGEPSTLDWISAQPIEAELPVVCESLRSIAPDGSIGPGLAESIDHPDPVTWVYKLRSGVKFHDGTQMTADDAVFSLRRAAFSDTSTVNELAGTVKQISKTGPFEVTVKLKKPDALFNDATATRLGIVESAAYVERMGKRYGTAQGPPLCTGPYELTDWKTGRGITLDAAKDYWNPDVKRRIQRIDVRFITDTPLLTSALVSGEVDGAFTLSPASFPQLRNTSGGTLTVGPSPEVMSIAPVGDDGPLGDRRIREALAYAIDRAAVAKTVYQGAAEPVRSIFSPAMWGYARDTFQQAYDQLPELSVDLDKAKQLVESAGSPGEQIVITVPAGLQEFVQTGTAIQSAAKQIGLNVKINAVPNTVFGAMFGDPSLRKSTDAILTTSAPPLSDPLVQAYRVLVPGGPRNYGPYDNPGVTRQFAEARATDDHEQRAKLLIDAQAKFMPDFPWIPIVAISGSVYQGPKVTGAPASQLGQFGGPWAATAGPRGE